MEFYFDIECDCEESEDAELENPDINSENYDSKNIKNEIFNNEESLLIFEEFFLIQKVKRGKKQKTTFIKNFGEENELKNFIKKLKFNQTKKFKNY